MDKTKGDHALATIKAGLNLVPAVGGALASLIGDYVPLSTQRGVEETVELLKRRLSEFEARIDINNVNKDEFAELFKSCYLVVVRTNQKTKLRIVSELIANILLKEGDAEKLSYKELDHYVRCLDGLSIGAIELLGNAFKIAQQDNARDLEKKSYVFNFERLRPRSCPPNLE